MGTATRYLLPFAFLVAGQSVVAQNHAQAQPQARLLKIGQVVHASLTTSALEFSFGLTADVYEVQAEAGDSFVVEAEAASFTPLLVLAEGTTLLPSGAIPEGRRSRYDLFAHRSGTFTMLLTVDPAVAYLRPTGPYTIELRGADPATARSRWFRTSIKPRVADYLDTQSFERVDTQRFRAWALTRYADLQEGASGHWDQIRLHFEIDCSARRSRITEGYGYLAGEVRAATGSLDWVNWPPESSFESLGRAVCTMAPAMSR